MEIKKPVIKSIPYEDFKDNEYLENMVKQLNEGGTKVLIGVWMTLSTGDAATRCGRLPLQPVAAELSLWQSVLPGMTLPVSGLK